MTRLGWGRAAAVAVTLQGGAYLTGRLIGWLLVRATRR